MEWIVVLVALGYFVMWTLPARLLGLSWLGLAVYWGLYWLAWRPRPWPALRFWRGWGWVRDRYFRTEMRAEGLPMLELERKMVYFCHPHGYCSAIVVFSLVLNPALEGITPVCNSIFFWLPIAREVVTWCGAIPATEGAIKRELERTSCKGLLMVPGGPREMKMTGNEVKEREGFAKLGCGVDAALVPVWSPDEKYCYRMWMPLGELCLDLRLLYPFPLLAWGAGCLPLAPPHPARLFLGRPVQTEGLAPEEAKRRAYEELRRVQRLADAENGARGKEGRIE